MAALHAYKFCRSTPPPIVIVLEHGKMRLVKGGRTGIIPFGLTNESVVRKALLADECEACVW